YLFVVPGLALLRTLRLGELTARLDRLEEAMRRLYLRMRQAPAPEQPAPAEARPVEAPPAPQREATPLPEPAPRPRPRLSEPPPRPAPPPDSGHGVESWLAQPALGWPAVVLLLFTAGFFVKYAFDNDWIGPQGQLTVCLAAAVGLCVAGLRRFRRPPTLGRQMLLAAGVVLLYLTPWAAFAFY